MTITVQQQQQQPIIQSLTIQYMILLLFYINMATKWNLIDEEWATELVGLRMKVLGSFWNGVSDQEKRTFYGGIIKQYNHDKKGG